MGGAITKCKLPVLNTSFHLREFDKRTIHCRFPNSNDTDWKTSPDY